MCIDKKKLHFVLSDYIQQNLLTFQCDIGCFSLSDCLWHSVSSGASLTSCGEGASLALVGNPSSDGIVIKMPYGVEVLH